jgi:hypothetical protein
MSKSSGAINCVITGRRSIASLLLPGRNRRVNSGAAGRGLVVLSWAVAVVCNFRLFNRDQRSPAYRQCTRHSDVRPALLRLRATGRSEL